MKIATSGAGQFQLSQTRDAKISRGSKLKVEGKNAEPLDVP
jgi:hypothetical protein